MEWITGGVTAPPGFRAGAVYGGIGNNPEKPDIGMLCASMRCTAAAVCTTNKVKAAPVKLTEAKLQGGYSRALVVNSGCANAFTGQAGMDDAVEMAEMAARRLGIGADEVLVASTGVIGEFLPMVRVREAIKRIEVKDGGGNELARAMMTTDTVPKEAAVSTGTFIVGGAAKGAGMIHPNMATMLAFVTTDAAVAPDFLKQSLRVAVDDSFNMISVDGDTSTNDTVLVMANGLAGNLEIKEGGELAIVFQEALTAVCRRLAKAIARDGEGATRLMEFTLHGAASLDDARHGARVVVTSPLVKAAVHGSDPNWGRIVAALGRSGIALEESRLDVSVGDIPLVTGGSRAEYDEAAASRLLAGEEVFLSANLNIGEAEATAWGCDLSPDYASINSEYTT